MPTPRKRTRTRKTAPKRPPAPPIDLSGDPPADPPAPIAADPDAPGLLSPGALAAASRLDAAPAEPGDDPPAPGAPGAPAAGDPPPDDAADLAVYQAEAAELVDQVYLAKHANDTRLTPRVEEVIENPTFKGGIAKAIGGLLHHYQVKGSDVVFNPWVGLVVVMAPVALAAWGDFRDYKAAKVAKAPPIAPAPEPIAPPPGNQVAAPSPPPSNLHQGA